MSKPHISTRKFIKWGDKPAGENTETLVLTTAAQHFVDIRIFLPFLPPSTPLPPTRLEWAFAGTSSSTPALFSSLPGHESDIIKPAHTIWTHWVDSKTTDDVRDEGDMIPQGNGETLETGRMVNPETGVEEAYTEFWIDMEIEKVESGGKGEYKSWALRCEDRERGVRGVVIRIGVFVQAVLRRGEDVSVVRWWARDGWKPVALIGNIDLPQEIFAEEDLVFEQMYKANDGLVWVCVESHSWT